MRRNPTKRPNQRAVWVKGYTRSDGVRVKGHWMTPASKRRKKATKKKARRRAAPKRRRTTRVASYLRKVPGKRKRTRVRAYTRKLAPKRRRRAAPKRRRRTTRVKSYMRKVPGKRKRTRVRAYTRKLGPKKRRAPARKRVNGRRKGKIVRVKGYTRADGKRVKGYSYRLKKGGRRKGRKGRIVRNRSALLSNVERRALARRMRRNPSGMMALLPAKDQLMIIGKKVGVGAVGFGGAVAMGVALNRVSALTNIFGNWTPVLGNVAAGLGYWALSSALDNEDLKEMRVPVAVGAGLAAVVNIANQLVARQTIPSNIASWILPGAGAVAAAPTEAIEPTNGNGALTNGALTNGALTNGALTNGTAGFGQIDVYEAALDGFGGIEEELEMELSHMGGMGMGDGVFDTSPDGIFDGMSGAGEYLSTPMGATVEEAYAGMGAQVEEAYAGTGEYLQTPMGEYLQTPMGEYLDVPMGAMVEEAYAGTGEYLDVPMGEYLQTPMGAMVEEAYAGMGAQVEEAYAGMGAAPIAQVEQSIRNRPLMPGFKKAVQKMVRRRIAAGKPLDDAFYGKVGRAAASLARKKFQQRAALVAGKPQDIVKAPWKAPLLRSSAPTYKKNIGDPKMVPGVAEKIATRGSKEYEGIFVDSDTDGIF